MDHRKHIISCERPAAHPRPPPHRIGLPADTRSKPGSAGQVIAFIPCRHLVVIRQTGSSGDWAFEEYLRHACAAVLPAEPNV